MTPVCVLILFLVLVLVTALIYAFPLGMVLNYQTGLMISWKLRIRPTLAKLLCRFMKKKQEESFRSTTRQFHENFAAKMHVDGNNHGLSRINVVIVFNTTFSLRQTNCVG